MGHDDPHQKQMDWAKLDLQRMETVGNMQIKGMMAQAEYAMKMMELLEKRVKIEKDITRLKILKDAFQNFKRERHELDAKIRVAESRVKTVKEHVGWLQRISLGQHVSQSLVTHVWSAFYYFLQQTPEPDLPVPTEACGPENFTRYVTVPTTETGPWGYILCLRKANTLPKTSTPAMRYMYTIVEKLCETAAQLTTQAAADANKAETKLARMQDSDWEQVFKGD